MELLFTWLSVLTDTQSPHLPLPQAEAIYLKLSWGVVLAAAAAGMTGRMWSHGVVRRWLCLVPLLLCLLPGEMSPAYWLGMAFRAPSLLFTGVVLHYLVVELAPSRAGGLQTVLSVPTMGALVVLGWVLALDTFAVWPVSLWSWGFAPLVVIGVLLVTLVSWLMPGGCGRVPWGPVVLALVYVLLRLPDGNAWSMVSDPWFWAWLHLMLLRRLVSALSRVAPTAG